MLATFVHHIDPVLGEVGGFYLWWYGLGYALGFLEIHLWLRRVRPRLSLKRLMHFFNQQIQIQKQCTRSLMFFLKDLSPECSTSMVKS